MFRQSTVLIASALLALQGCSQITSAPITSSSAEMTAPKNIIMVVTDGMGPAYTTAYRNYKDDPATPEIEGVILDDIFVGNASTYPAHVSGYVTDSAAAATALATGVKSYNGAIGVDVNKKPVQSVLQYAKSKGLKTGVAVTSQINHATPASYVAHNESRKNYNEIADSFFDDRINGNFVADVMLGGGTNYFEREDRDLVAQFIDAGYQYVDTYNRLAAVPTGSKVLGLFAPVGLPWTLDDKRKNRLAYMTEHAIKHLENDEGFFLLVEASQVDWGGHANDIAAAMGEMDDMAKMMTFLYGYVQTHPDTLVVMTADHSTGGLTIGANGTYEWRPEYLRGLKGSPIAMAKALGEQENPVAYMNDMLGFTLTDEEAATVNVLAKLDNVREIETGIKHLLDIRTNTGWTTGGHTGVDVEVFAFGKGKEAFYGQYDNTDIAKKIFHFLAQHKGQVASPENETTNEQGSSASGCDFKSDWRCQ